MKKTMALLLASAMLFSCTACAPKNNENADDPSITAQAGVIVDESAVPTAGLNNTLEPEATMYLPEATDMQQVTAAPQGEDEPFEKGQYVVNFYKTPDKGEFSAPGYVGYTVARSRSDIDAYIKKFESMMDFDAEFKEAMEKYNDAFFKNKALVFIMHEEAEGQGCGRVQGVEQFEDYVCITLKCTTPWSSYDDPNSVAKVRYQCVIEMNQDDIINNDITVFEFE